MSKFGSSSFSVLLADGYNLLAAKVKGVTYGYEHITEQTDGLGDGNEEHTPVGMTRATFAQNGAFFDDATNGMHLAFRGNSGTARILSWAYMGNTIGKAFVGALGGLKTKYDAQVSVGGLTKANVAYQVDGAIDEGIIVQDHVAKTADWNTKTDGDSVDYTLDPTQRVIPITSNSIANPTVVTTPVDHGLTTGDIILIADVATSDPTINGEQTVTVISDTTFSVPVNVTTGGTGGTFVRANSSNGGVGYQQVSALSGFSGFVGKIRDSADDTTYADLVTFADVTAAPNAQRIEVAGVVDRYLSFDGDVTGTGSITPFAGLSRG
jgi:hypothetical protein